MLAMAAAAVSAVLAAAGCASRGNDVLRTQDAAIVDRHIIDGQTTRSDVERIYGPPDATSFANAQNDIWIYRWSRATVKAENLIPVLGAFVGGTDVQSKALVIVFNAQNVVVRHSMRETNDAIRRNLSASSSPVPSTPGIQTSPAPQPASVPAVAVALSTRSASAGPATPAPTPSSIAPGRWTCGLRSFSSSADGRYTISFVVSTGRAITVTSYNDAPATIVNNSPLTFTAVNPRGSRLTTFTLKPDNAIAISGPYLNNPAATFYDEGGCVRSA
jgi:hypothetical protein